MADLILGLNQSARNLLGPIALPRRGLLLFFFSSRRRHTRYWRTGVQTCALPILDVVRVVPVVERRADRRAAPREHLRARAGVVVRLVAVARWVGVRPVERGGDVEPTPAGERVAPVGAAAATRCLRLIGGRALQPRHHLLGSERRPRAPHERGAGADDGGREGGPLRAPEVLRTAVGVTLLDTGGALRGQRTRQRREQLVAWSGDVVVDHVAVGEHRHRTVPRLCT